MYDDLATSCIERSAKHHASFSDVRFVRIFSKSFIVDDSGFRSEKSLTESFGVRAILNGAWGFCGSADLSRESCENVSERATKIARASASAPQRK